MASAVKRVKGATIVIVLSTTSSTAHIPSRLVPSGLVRKDGKSPDGVTMIPWKNGKPLVWDVTCPDTLAQSYRHQATSKAGAVADLAEERKIDKYGNLGAGYSFTPVAIESLGPWGRGHLLLRENWATESGSVPVR